MEAATVDLDTPAGVLAAVREDTAVVNAGEARRMLAAVAWAAMHSVDSITDAATYADFGGDTGMPVAGPGAPLVSEFSIVEFAAAIGLPTEAGKAYLGEAVELRYRLPRLWARVVAGDLVAWKARKTAKATIILSAEAAAFVDRHLAPVAHKVGPTQTDRLIDEAIARFMPDEAERRRKQAADGRRLDIDTRQASLQGTATVYGELDLADAIDLDTALSAGAETLKTLARPTRWTSAGPSPPGSWPAASSPSTSTPRPDQATRRAERPDEKPTKRKARKPRQVVLYLHLAQAAVQPAGSPVNEVGRVENTRAPITAEQIRLWCGNPDAEVVVKPVIDLNEHIQVDAYEIGDRLTEQTILVHGTACSPGAPDPPGGCDPTSTTPTATTSSPTGPAGTPVPATSPPSAGSTTGPRPTPPGPTSPSNAAATCGPARTACSTCATTPAPSTSPPTNGTAPPRPRTHPTTDSTAPHPAGPPPAGTSARPGALTGCVPIGGRAQPRSARSCR